MAKVLTAMFCGGSRDGEKHVVTETEGLAVPVTSTAGVAASELYQRRRVNGIPIVVDGASPFDFMLRRRGA